MENPNVSNLLLPSVPECNNMALEGVAELYDHMRKVDLGQVFRHIFLRIFINYSSFAGAVDINIKENL